MDKVAFYPGEDEFGAHAIPLFSAADAYFEKVAAPLLLDPVIRYISALRPRDDAQYVLTNAMGASEYYGSNVNGDYFPEEALIHAPDKWIGTSVIDRITAKDWPYGYPTFYDAYPFAHHRNKDSSRAFGEVELAAWNDRMKRVELVIRVDLDKCKQFGGMPVWDRLKAGQYPDVSMGCFTAGNLVTMADGTRKPIEDVQVGDFVLTHLGNAKKVTKVHRRQYSGPLYSIRAESHETITATNQHPFWCVRDFQVKTQDSYRRWRTVADVSPSWVSAEDLDDHHLLEPVVQDVVTPDWVDRAFCRLFGYYLAEGHVLRDKNKNIVGIEFNVHKEDFIHIEIEELCAQFGTKNPPTWHDRPNSEHAQGICVFDKRLAELCYEHGGGYAQKKRMSFEALRWHPDMQREILGAYANGDGVASCGALKLSTSSTYLAWQWMVVLPRLGILSSIQHLEHKAGNGFNKHVTYEWVIHIGKQWAQGLADVCAKIIPSDVLKAKSSRKILNGYVVTPIRESVAEEATVEVFNLEVEDDSSYLVAGLAVHNCRVPWDLCSICGDVKLYKEALTTFTPNKHKHPGIAVLEFHKKLKEKNGVGIRGLAITRKDYCDHALKQMNRILPDGRKVYVINYFPRFFDISFVFVGADKTAKVMLKLAEDRKVFWFLPGAELAEKLGYQTFEAPSELIVFDKTASIADEIIKMSFLGKGAKDKRAEIEKDITSQLTEQAIPVVTKHEPSLPNDLIDELCKHPLEDVLSTSSGMGIVLKPHEFQRIILIKINRKDLADDFADEGKVFPKSKEIDSVRLGPEFFSDVIAKLLAPFFTDRSALAPALEGRLLHPGESIEKKSSASSHSSEVLRKISSAYNGYREQVMELLAHAPLAAKMIQDEVCLQKVASLPLTEVFTESSVIYVNKAYWDEVTSV